MDEAAWYKLKSDALIVSDLVSMTLACDVPYMRRIALNASNGKKLDRDYQAKLSKVLVTASMKSFPEGLFGTSFDYEASMNRSLNLLISSIDSIQTDDPCSSRRNT